MSSKRNVVHRQVLNLEGDHNVCEWIPLLTHKGEPIWRHMSRNWRIYYHTLRALVQSVERMNNL